ncbi:MAG: hypothetical protein K6E91_00715 [Butyrivibrio sp.]|nr:hypothetical protein [Butyrivibrio sp.]
MSIISYDTRYILEGSMTAVTLLAVLAILFFSPLRKSKEQEDKILRQLFIAVLLFAATDLVREFQFAFGFVKASSPPGLIIYFLPDLMEITYILLWLIFVDYTVCKNLDSIRVRYRLIPISYCVLIALQIVYAVLMIRVFDEYEVSGEVTPASMNMYTAWGWIYYAAFLLFETGCMIYAFCVMRYHQKESRLPLFLRLDAFIIPFVIALIAKNIPGFYLHMDVICAMLSVLLTYLTVRKRYLYLDFETGFYNEAFLKFVSSYVKKQGYSGGSVIEIRVPGHEKEFADMFKKIKPEESLMIRMKDGSFLLISSVNSEIAIRCFDELLSEGARSLDPDIKISTRHWIRDKKEDIPGFTERVLAARA